MKKRKAKILVFDIETAPNLGAYFQLYREGNIVWTERDWYIMSWVAKWVGDDTVISRSLPDYKSYKTQPENDFMLCEELWDLLNEADVVIAHNGDQFDIKKVNTRFIIHGLLAPTPYQTIDTKKVAKRYFGFDSNKLNDLGRQLGCGEKEDTGGIDLWKDCLNGDLKAWKKMMKYNKQDVLLLERIYMRLRPWMLQHPNMNVLNGTMRCCKNCGGDHLTKSKSRPTRTGIKDQFQCQDCGAYSTESRTERIAELV